MTLKGGDERQMQALDTFKNPLKGSRSGNKEQIMILQNKQTNNKKERIGIKQFSYFISILINIFTFYVIAKDLQSRSITNLEFQSEPSCKNTRNRFIRLSTISV